MKKRNGPYQKLENRKKKCQRYLTDRVILQNIPNEKKNERNKKIRSDFLQRPKYLFANEQYHHHMATESGIQLIIPNSVGI